ncbi:hypothetical protein GCM10011608_40080 [Micromonospora sonchi]|uniref:WD40 repeat domain-containing protein n=1 Tax=Micromonospora sonchi TaxID=1763543 RepID=A0A917WZT9_9ACTN|nr:hypothetical protein [Micromonospora sonchi]GGM51172.1 hypothetical protein GCM10011608_40080 [Micromonospora sonchi]
MTTQLENAVREALDQLTDVPPPADLAQAAIRTAGRRRTARLAVTGVAGVAAALVAVPVAIGVLASPGGNLSPAVTGQAPVVKPFVVTAYSGVDNPGDMGPADDYSLLLDPSTGEYDKVPYNEVVPSPDGSQVVVHVGDNSPAYPSRRGVLDRESGQVRWLPGNAGYTSGASWSPDGRQVLITNRPKHGGGDGFLLVDAATLDVRQVEVPDVSTQNTNGLAFVWTPDGTGVALTHSVSDSESEPGRVTGIGFYDLSGKPTRTLRVTGGSLHDGGGFSPDGSRIALDNPLVDDRIQIVDVVTGTIEQDFSVPTAGTVVGWYDNEHLIVKDYGDRDLTERPSLKVVDLTGEVIQTVQLADGSDTAQRVYVGSSADLSSAAEKLAF